MRRGTSFRSCRRNHGRNTSRPFSFRGYTHTSARLILRSNISIRPSPSARACSHLESGRRCTIRSGSIRGLKRWCETSDSLDSSRSRHDKLCRSLLLIHVRPETEYALRHQQRPAGVGRQSALETGDEVVRSEEHTSELQSPCNLVCRLLLEKK